jgi:general L-amino acid transport system substrate-binding protein
MGKFARLALVASLTVAVTEIAHAAATLETVRARGVLRCGVSTGLPGFAMPDAQGVFSGLDVDVCRAIGAAVFGDARKVQYVPLTAVQRFLALQSGEVDVLARNATWTLARNAQLGLNFVATNYYDGQGFMVPRTAGVRGIADLNGATICVQPGTSTEIVLADAFRQRNLRFTPVVIEQVNELAGAYFSGRCDAFTSDQSQLTGIRSTAPDPAAHAILPEIISKEPLSPAVRNGDDGWANVVRWSFFAMLEAEELGLDSRNIERQARDSADPAVQRFVGNAGDLGKALGLENGFAVAIISQVGNYAESFERNIGPLGIDRGVNRLWKNGGLMISPPFR